MLKIPAIVCRIQHDISKKAELDSEYLCFDEFPELRFGLAAKLQTEKLAGDLQDAEYLFREEFRLLQQKCDLLVDDQDLAYSFLNAQNRDDAAQRLQSFVHCEVSFEETFHRRFAVLALYLCPRASP
jgi:hypothetical protein